MTRESIRAAAIAAGAAMLVVLSPRHALAAGLDIPDLGAASLGKGAADAAAPDTLMAIYYNPAGLADQQGFRFLVDVRALQDKTTFQRVSYGTETKTYAPVSDTGNKALGGFLPAPAVAVSYGFHLVIPWAVGLALMTPPGYSGDQYPDYFAIRAKLPTGSSSTVTAAAEAPQRYNLISANNTAFIPSLTLAARVVPFLSLGAQLQDAIYSFDTSQALYLYTHPGESSAYDADVTVKAMNGFQPTGAFGASAKLPFGFSIGASYQLPVTITGTGTMDIAVPPSSALASAKVCQTGGPVGTCNALKGNNATLTIHLPWTGRLGVRVNRPLFELELDGVYEAWSEYNDITLAPHGLFVQTRTTPTSRPSNTTIPTSVIPTGMTDAYSVRLGGELRFGALASVLSFLKLRAGFIYESSAVPIEWTSLTETNWDHVIPTVGLGFVAGPIDIDVAYAHVFQPERIVQDSQVLQSTGPGVTPAVVGNGTYNVNINMLALAVSGHFG